MYGMQDKAKIRLKAMESMMKDKPSVMIKMEEGESEMPEGEEYMGDKGMISMAISPEEKMMIMKLRKQKGMGGEESIGSEDEMMA